MPLPVAQVMSRFPVISETFILSEILELERLGFRVEVFPLVRERASIVHPEAERVAEHAHYVNPLSPRSLAAQLSWLLRRPRTYLGVWRSALAGNRHSARFLVRAIYVIPQAAAFARDMRRLEVRHIHAHYATHPALAAYVASRLTGIPYSFTVHAHDLYVERAMLGEKIGGSRFVVAVSDYNRSMIERLYGREAAEKTHVIRSGIDAASFPRRRARAGEAFTLICVASLQDYKGHPYLIDACARLRTAGLDFRCLLVGEGEDRGAIEQQVRRLGLSEHVLICGAQPRSRVRELLGKADLLVLPSVVTASGKKEGLPVALMEGMAAGLPVIATDISGIPELVRHEDTGLLVPERDVAALETAVSRLHDDPDLAARLGEAGRRVVVERHDLRTNVARLGELLSGNAG